MRHKMMVRYTLISVVLVSLAVCLAGSPLDRVNASPPMSIRSKLQPYQTPGAEPSQTGRKLFGEARAPEAVEPPGVILLAQQTFYSIADATVLQGYPAVNLGSTTDMWAGYDDGLDPEGQIARSLVRFDISSLPADVSISQATLRLYLVSCRDYPSTSRTITTYRILSSWLEGSVTWNSKPGYQEDSYGSADIVCGEWDWYDFDVTDLVRAWYRGEYTNYGIMVRGPEVSGIDSSWRGLGTRESTYRPQLVVEYVSLEPPSNLDATPISQTQISLSWQDNSGDENGFKIERSPDGATGWTQIATVGANVTIYINSGLTCNTTYYYRVRAYNASGDSDYSNTANTTTFPCSLLPAAPSNLTATSISRTQINLSWQDNSNNENGFKIERSPNGATGWTQIATVGAGVTTYANTGLTCNTTYYYRVRAYNAAGDSGYSNTANATTSPCSLLPAAPSNLTSTPISQTQVSLTWQDNSDNESGFRVDQLYSGVTDWTQIATVGANVTAYTNTGLACGTTYYYRLRAYNGNGDSDYSNVAAAITFDCSYSTYLPCILNNAGTLLPAELPSAPVLGPH